MTWKFQVSATENQRLFSRILQVLDAQMVSIHSFIGQAREDGVSVHFVVSSEVDKAYRIEALLHHLKDVLSVSVLFES